MTPIRAADSPNIVAYLPGIGNISVINWLESIMPDGLLLVSGFCLRQHDQEGLCGPEHSGGANAVDTDLHTWQFIVLALATWLNRQQHEVVASLTEAIWCRDPMQTPVRRGSARPRERCANTCPDY